jgi:predicted Zn finger-like uncharacterized protein
MNVSCPDCRSIFRVDPAKVPPTGVRARCSVCSGVISIPAPSGQTTPAGIAPIGRPAESPAFGQGSSPTPSGWDTAIFGTPEKASPRAEEAGRSSAAATATPPSAASSVPEFIPPPPLPPFRPSGPPSAPAAGPSATPTTAPFVPGSRSAAPSRAPTPPSAASPGGFASQPSASTSMRSTTPPTQSPAPRSATPGASPTASSASESTARRPLNPFLSKDPDQRAKRLARALVSDIITYHPAKHAEGLRDGTLKQLFREEIKKSFEEYIAQVGQQLAESTTYFQEALNEVLGAGKKIF